MTLLSNFIYPEGKDSDPGKIITIPLGLLDFNFSLFPVCACFFPPQAVRAPLQRKKIKYGPIPTVHPQQRMEGTEHPKEGGAQ